MSWENGSLNEVTVEGIISEIKLEQVKDENNVDVIRGEYKIKTTNVINGTEYNVEIPIRVYQSKLTSNKKMNPAYATAEKIMKDYVSIAAGGMEKATAVRLPEKYTSLQENFFKNKNTDQMIFTSGIRTSFVNEVSKSDLNPGARFKTVVVIGELQDEIDRNDEETGRLILKGIIPQYGGRVDVIDFIVDNKKVIDHIKNKWHKGDTVLIGGYINYTSVVESQQQDSNTFGEIMPTQRTRSIREYLITGGHDEPLTEDEGAYSTEDISAALQDRQARIEKKKNEAKKEVRKSAPDFGF